MGVGRRVALLLAHLLLLEGGEIEDVRPQMSLNSRQLFGNWRKNVDAPIFGVDRRSFPPWGWAEKRETHKKAGVERSL